MLTGVEVAGILLAIIPIFQAATDPDAQLAPIEHFRTAISAKRKAQKLAEFLKTLHFEVSILQITLRRLIDQLHALTDAHRAALKLGDLWSEPRVSLALKQRLHAGYDSFHIHLTDLLENLESLVEDTTIDLPSGQAEIINPQATLAKLFELRQNKSTTSDFIGRIRFSFKHSRRTRTLKAIREHNERLEELLGHHPPNSADMDKSNWAKRSSNVQLRPLMHTLYNTLGGLWRCNCNLPHQARFCLLQCPQNKKSSQPDDPPGAVYFDMLMSIQADATDEYCTWLAGTICVALSEQRIIQTASRTVRFQAGPPSPTPPASPDKPLARTLSGMTAVSSTKEFNTTRTSPPLSPITSNPRKAVETICEVFMRGIGRTCCPRMLFDGLMLSHMRPTRPTLDIETSEPSTSLATLLEGQRKFTLKEKRMLAVILAHSVLHFCESPWMSRHWNKNHVSFFRFSNRGDFNLERPWLSPDFANPYVPEDVEELNRIHPNPSVLALGILLLEIELGDSLESFKEADDLSCEGLEDCNTSFFTAHHVWENMLDNVYWGYKAAVEACLNCDFFESQDGLPLSLEDEDFHEAVYKNIVQPLEEELWTACRVRPEEIGLEKF